MRHRTEATVSQAVATHAPGEVVLRLTGVSKAFDGIPVLDKFDLTVCAGEVVGLIGPGGSGKSVIMKLCCGLLEPDAGTIEVLGHELTTLGAKDRQRLRTRVGLSFQNYALFDFMTVGDNVAFPLVQRGELAPCDVAAKVKERLAEVGLPRVQHLMPNELSGGMRKRVGIARAGVNDPELLFYDDPTAGLDPVTSSKIFNLVKHTQQSRHSTCVVVSHDIDRMRAVCDRYVLLYDAKVHFEGTASEALCSRDPVVSEFFQRDTGLAP